MSKDLAFLESLNQKLIAELDASVALEKELRERLARLEGKLVEIDEAAGWGLEKLCQQLAQEALNADNA